MHYQRFRKFGDVNYVTPTSQWKPRRVDATSYSTAHWRLRQDRGRAPTHLCYGCGERAAEQWAYMNNSSEELFEAERRCRYSMNPTDYEAMCTSCHKIFDWSEREPKVLNG